jgi:hypothetical protein
MLGNVIRWQDNSRLNYMTQMSQSSYIILNQSLVNVAVGCFVKERAALRLPKDAP